MKTTIRRMSRIAARKVLHAIRQKEIEQEIEQSWLKVKSKKGRPYAAHKVVMYPPSSIAAKMFLDQWKEDHPDDFD